MCLATPTAVQLQRRAGARTIKSIHPAIKAVSGSFTVEQGGTLTAPALTKCGDVRVEQGGTLTAPALKQQRN